MSHYPYARPQRVAEAIKRRMGEIITRQLKDPRIGLVSITRVEVSPDLKQARIYISTYGDRQTLQILENAKGFIRQEIARGVKLKSVPEISFLEDASIEESFHIKEILESLHQEEKKI